MARGRLITDREKIIVAKVALSHPEWCAKQVQQEVHKQLGCQRDNEDRKWPGLSAIQKEMTKIRKRTSSLDTGLDQPWSMASLLDYPLSPDALPSVLKAWVHYQESFPDWDWAAPFSIRQARWVARLYRIVKDTDIGLLTSKARHYSMVERWAELSGAKIIGDGSDIELYEILTGDRIPEGSLRREKIVWRKPIISRTSSSPELDENIPF